MRKIVEKTLQIEQNIYRLYEKLIIAKKTANKEEKEKTIEYLDLAMEYEEKLIQEFVEQKDIENIIEEVRQHPDFIDQTEDYCILSSPNANLPLQRLYYILEEIAKERKWQKRKNKIDLLFSKKVTSPQIGKNQLKQAIDMQIQEEKEEELLKNELMLNYLWAFELSKKSDEDAIKYYFQFVYLNKTIETVLRNRGFEPVEPGIIPLFSNIYLTNTDIHPETKKSWEEDYLELAKLYRASIRFETRIIKEPWYYYLLLAGFPLLDENKQQNLLSDYEMTRSLMKEENRGYINRCIEGLKEMAK